MIALQSPMPRGCARHPPSINKSLAQGAARARSCNRGATSGLKVTMARAESTSRNGGNDGRAADVRPGGSLFVGIGASAGALEPLERFFSLMPADTGLVFGVVQHLDRHHPSVLAELLGKQTRMPVGQAEDGARPLPNHVYIIPPNAVLTLEQGRLRVARPAEDGMRAPIDAFLRSLAREQGERAIGIILSGAGSDGTAGLRAIKEQGGFALAQAPETAKYDSMPQHAIAAGLVDLALPIEEMPARILSHAGRVLEVQRKTVQDLDEQVAAQLGSICEILQRHTGHDFSRYKHGTLLRRIRRRIQLQPAVTVEDYVRTLDQDPNEAEQLHRDLLIGVTQFFRDPEVFATLATQVVPAIVGRGDPSAAVRIWVPGCASGEEAYSLAILLREHLARVDVARSVQIFATDIDSELLATARPGHYAEQISEQVSSERLQRFFVRDEDGYRVGKEVRAMCTFSEHSLIRDPPFSSLDLISCRNVLIYLGGDLQQKLVPLFHYALRPGGFLLLGPSEGVAAHSELFATVDKKQRLFSRQEGVPRPALEFPLTGRSTHRTSLARTVEAADPVAPQAFSQAFERMILEEYAPPCAVTNEHGDILYLAGRAGRYLQVAAGAPTHNLFNLAQGSLRVELRNALAKAVSGHRKVVRDNLAIELDRGVEHLRLTARPLPTVVPESGLYAIVLQSMSSAADLAPEEEAITAPELPIIEQLENELRTTRADLQSAMQDLESANEELKSANEELISTNEELQSANEELQTSKEELQSANDELHAKVLELDATNADLQHHYAGTQIATIFLDRELRILRCTPAASQLFGLRPSDAGRPIRDLAPRFVEGDLLADLATVLRTETGIERKVHRAEGPAWFLERILPYRSEDQSVTGVGITFVDITDLERAEEAARRYGDLLRLSHDAIFVWRLDGGIETWNRGAELLYGFSPEEAQGQTPLRLLETEFPLPFADVVSALRRAGQWEGELGQRTKSRAAIAVSCKLLLLRGDDGVDRVLESNRDITQNKAAEVERERLIEALREADWRKDGFLAMLSHELRNPLAPIRNCLFILERAAPGSEQVRRAEEVLKRQVAQLTRIVDDLLDVTRVARGKLQVKRRPLELGDLVRRTVEDNRLTLANAGLELTVSVVPRPLWVNGDFARLAQALGNLLANAAKFTARGGHVQVVLEESAGLPGMAVLRVRDDGVGINPDLLGHLFEPFVQADRTLDRSRGGLGLGLALVKGLVEQHDGQVQASSDGLGRGAELTIRLPLLNVPPAEVSGAARPPQAGTRRILVIEDNVDAADSLRDALTLAQHQVVVAYRGAAGLEVAREFKPDVVLCDIGLPEMDGYQIARAIRADEQLREVQLIALTGYALPQDLAKAKTAGFDQHLAKPLSIEKLEEALASGPPTR